MSEVLFKNIDALYRDACALLPRVRNTGAYLQLKADLLEFEKQVQALHESVERVRQGVAPGEVRKVLHYSGQSR